MPNHDPQRLAHWRALLAEQVQSGLSIEAFCRQRTIGKSGFHRWKTILATLDSGVAEIIAGVWPSGRTQELAVHRQRWWPTHRPCPAEPVRVGEASRPQSLGLSDRCPHAHGHETFRPDATAPRPLGQTPAIISATPAAMRKGRHFTGRLPRGGERGRTGSRSTGCRPRVGTRYR